MLKIIIYIAVYLFGHYTGHLITGIFYYLKEPKGKHYCNDCKVAYNASKEEIEMKYCGYCGKPLEEINLDDE